MRGRLDSVGLEAELRMNRRNWWKAALVLLGVSVLWNVVFLVVNDLVNR